MKIAIMQPYLFPYVGYFQLLTQVDKFVLFDDVSYIKKGWINRNRILVNSNPQFITIPCNKISQNKLIKDIITINDKLPYTKLLKTIEHAYNKAPFFSQVMPIIEAVFSKHGISIAEMAATSINLVLDYLGMNKKILFSSKLNYNKDFEGLAKILAICKILNADTYINMESGRLLYNVEAFQNENISLKFLKPLMLEYKQFNEQFISGLSIVDVLMFNNKNAVVSMLYRSLISD
ncbi:MAG: WbqC family protein [Burkholderiales bacterium]